MKEYQKIQTVFKRDPENKNKTLLMGQYSLPEFEYLADNHWIFTEKVDGMNIRIGMESGRLVIKARTDNAQIPTFLLTILMEIFSPKKLYEMFEDSDDFCLYGEGYGAKIQKGGGNYKSDGTDFVLFDVQVGDWWLKRGDVSDVASKLGIEIVPITGQGTLHELISCVREGITSQWGEFTAEGIVARPKVELKTRSGSRIITKLKMKDFH